MPTASVVNQRTIDEAFLWLLTVRDKTSKTVLRAVNNLEDVVSRGNTYTAYPFALTLPPDDGQRPQNVQLSVGNVARELTEVLRATLEPPEITLELVLSNSPSTVEKTIDFMTVAEATYDVMKIDFVLAPSNLFARKTCTATFNQAEYPALFFSLGS